MGSKHILQWHITHLCNLRCTHCYQDDYNSHLGVQEFYSALNKYEAFIKERGLKAQINLTGGEPLMHPRFFEFAREIKKRGMDLGILTNGTLIDTDMAAKIAKLKPVFVQVSLDGTEQTHDNIRGKGSFIKTLGSIYNLKKHMVKVLVSFTAQKCNYRDYPALAEICYGCGVDKLWWDRVVTYTPEDIKEQALSTEEFKWLVKKCNKLKKKYKINGNSIISNSRALQCIGTKDCGYECNAGRNLLILLANGDIMPCRRLPFVIGNINNIEHIMEFVRDNEIMAKLQLMPLPRECIGCKYKLKCSGGSRCVTYAQTGELNRRDVNCFVK